jgi:hypothetical protein
MANQRNELRHILIERLAEEWPRTHAGKLVKGFWPMAAYEVALMEGPKAPPAPELQVWWFKHRRICDADAETLLAMIQQASRAN